MKLQSHFPRLEELMARMDATSIKWIPSAPELEPLADLRRRLAVGIEINIDEVEWSHGGLLSYKGEQVILYIKDTRQAREILLNEPEKAKKFHVYHCKTLDEMIKENRLQRYVVTQRKDGCFAVIATDPKTKEKEEFETRLNVCKNCLDALGYLGYNREAPEDRKDELVRSFDISSFLRDYQTFFLRRPDKRDFEVRPDNVGYVTGWDRISRAFRDKKSWTCEACGVDLSTHQGLLHAHHIDGDVRNNRPQNLRALCALCHAEQPYHSHLKISDRDRQIIERLRESPKSRRPDHRLGARA